MTTTITLADARACARAATAATALHEAAHVIARGALGLEILGVAMRHDGAEGLAAADALAEVVVPARVVDARDLAVVAMAGPAIEAMLEAGVDDPAPAQGVAAALWTRIDVAPRTPGGDLDVAGRHARGSAPTALALITTHWDAVTAVAGMIAAGGAWTPWAALAPHVPTPTSLLGLEALDAWDDLMEACARDDVYPEWL